MVRISWIAPSILLLLSHLVPAPATAQIAAGAITGTVQDTSGAVLPGVAVSLSGERLIGGVQTQTTDTAGNYRFERLPPGAYTLKFELSGFKSVERTDIRVNAAFTATVNVQLEVGELQETVTVAGESPTVDVRSNLQQTVMDQEILEGVPTGRDPWSVAKLIPGVQVGTYDVGGTQSIQQSALSAHGSNTSDVTYNIDGAAVNWPGGGGGATMLYYDQGMFEEVNYQTSAIPAEVMAGGLSINMVTKESGNRWRGNARYYYANESLQSDNTDVADLQRFNFLGNPTTRLYDFNIGGGGALVSDRVWFTGSLRRWVVDKLTNARNDDGSRAVDDNTLTNYSGKVLWQVNANHKVGVSYNWNNKIRGHRRDTPPDFVPDIAALLQENPASSTQVKYTGVRNRTVFESSYSAMLGETDYFYQPGTPPDAIRVVDTALSTAANAAPRQEMLPNSRIQFDNVVSHTLSGAGEHLLKAGVQFARLYMNDQFRVNGDMYLEYNNGRPTQVRLFNTPTAHVSIERVLGFFVQDSWTVARRLTLNLGMRYDRNTGIIPEQSIPGGTFVAATSLAESRPIQQSLAVWRSGLAYDLSGDGRTAAKASYSRYGLQVGLDRIQNVHPFGFQNQTCPWTDPNGDRRAQTSEIAFDRCTGFPGLTVRYARPEGPDWPYSDEITAGVEHQMGQTIRLGVMYYHRTNRDQIGTRNTAIPTSAYTPVTVQVPGPPTGPGGTATVYNLNPAFIGRQDNVLDNDPYLDTDYNGVEFTAAKRFSNRWQLVAGLTIGKNEGGVNSATSATGQVSTPAGDLNDPNITANFPEGIIGTDSAYAFRLSGSYRAPFEITIAGSLIANQGYPFTSTYNVTRTVLPGLTRASQVVRLSARGDERLPNVVMGDVRISRAFRFGASRQITPQLDLFNLGNVWTIVRYNPSVGGAYLAPAEIVAPRIVRVGFSIDF